MYKDNLLFHNSFVNQIGLTGKFCGRACTIFSVLLTITVLGTSSLSSPGHVSLIGNFPPLSLSQPLCLILTFDNNCNQRQSCSLVEIDHKNWVFLVRWVVLDLDRPMTMCRLQTPPGRFSSISLLQSESRTQCNGAGSCTELIALILLATIMSATKTNPRGIIYNADALNKTKQLSSKPRALFLCLDGCSVAQEHQVYVGLAEQYLQKTRGGSSCSNASLIEWLVSRSVSPLSDLY